MKANEAPDKLYLSDIQRYFDDTDKTISTIKYADDDIEYTRTDAFIEKAKKWLTKNADDYTWYDEIEGESGMTDEFVDDFVNYMKGE